jgi:hypothetical protein
MNLVITSEVDKRGPENYKPQVSVSNLISGSVFVIGPNSKTSAINNCSTSFYC